MTPYVSVDSQDPERITPFWCDLLGVQVVHTRDDGQRALARPQVWTG